MEDIDKLSNWELSKVLCTSRPKCTKDRVHRLPSFELACVLAKWPDIAWLARNGDLLQKLRGDDASWLLRDRPELFDALPKHSMDSRDWAYLLRKQPQFADHCLVELTPFHFEWLKAAQPKIVLKLNTEI